MAKPAKGNNKPRNKPTTDQKPPAVGYGRPPAHTRFQKGKSGNPGGRPKGAKNLRTLICEFADDKVTLTTPSGRSVVTIREAVARKYLEMMLRGEHKFIQAFHGLEKEWETELKREAARQGEREAEMLQEMIKEIFLGREDEETVDENDNDADESD